jgi:serine/threonine protein kinase
MVRSTKFAASCLCRLCPHLAQFVSDQTTDDITPLGLRPPEIVLGGEWDQSVDIWTFGCLVSYCCRQYGMKLSEIVIHQVFTLLTHRPLFKPMKSPEDDASEEDVLLFQMIIFCGEFFKPDLLRRCSRSLDYFNPDCASPLNFSPMCTRRFFNDSDQVHRRNLNVSLAKSSRNVFFLQDVY